MVAILLTLSVCIRSIRISWEYKRKKHPFPWWGGVGVFSGIISWILAWTRFSWFGSFQPHTFTPLWISYIVVLNALSYRRKGSCIMQDNKLYFFLLFPLSSDFWWFFEYLNRFVQNWYYTGVHFGAFEYFLYATISFSTVLPAVISTRDWLLTYPFISNGSNNWSTIGLTKSKYLAWFILIISGAGLALIGVWPDYLFPLLWVSPLLIIVSLQVIGEKQHILTSVDKGDYTLVVSSALAALFCGFFWELWNYWSLAKWEYAIPLVHRFELFEMPLLGYTGYLPFGLECAVAGKMLESLLSTRPFSSNRLISP